MGHGFRLLMDLSLCAMVLDYRVVMSVPYKFWLQTIYGGPYFESILIGAASDQSHCFYVLGSVFIIERAHLSWNRSKQCS